MMIMNTAFCYTTEFVLDKAYYSECFDESVNQAPGLKPYTKALIFFITGLGLLLTQINNYASWFIIALGVLEALSIKFKRPWWLLRQSWSRASGNKATLTLDEVGIKTHSLYINSSLSWQKIDKIEETEKGFLLYINKQKQYLSKGYLDNACCDFIRSKI
ncbi:YcxB family protein [Shewanella sp. AS1]|uniref:YcxB family protein n=1 Tax=Shewanella sp. AS1 TaxID=2907626 RepID=UPI001F2AB4AE|nr:YcxB family protein [Shewanella sp. AS1]MCE9677871.1 YcxB family protein [Shewanella sp. AS1]